MRLAIMQPYLLPYLGYFALAAAVDRFVFLDDCQYIKNGWINRNRWWQGGQARWFTFPVLHDGAERPIDAVRLQPGMLWRRKLLAGFTQAYRRLPGYAPTLALWHDLLDPDRELVGELAKDSIKAVCRRLQLPVQFVDSSRHYGNSGLAGSERVLDICRREGATTYVNLPGGRGLYDPHAFSVQGIALRFIPERLPPHPAVVAAPAENLSVLDALLRGNDGGLSQHLAQVGVEA